MMMVMMAEVMVMVMMAMVTTVLMLWSMAVIMAVVLLICSGCVTQLRPIDRVCHVNKVRPERATFARQVIATRGRAPLPTWKRDEILAGSH